MKYLDYRNKIKSGDLLAWTYRGWRSWYDFKIQMVRVFTQSEFAHVGVAWEYGDRLFVIESVTPYIRIVPLSNLLPAYWVSVSAPWSVETERFVLSLVGKAKYSQTEAVKAFLSNNNLENDAWQCAELVHALWLKDKVPLFPLKDTPSAVVAAAMEHSPLVLLEP